jgi:hypothetical protein
MEDDSIVENRTPDTSSADGEMSKTEEQEDEENKELLKVSEFEIKDGQNVNLEVQTHAAS